jgi:LysM domain
MRTFLALLIAASTLLGQTPNKAVPQQGAPPKNLTVHADGHVSANKDAADADKFEVHVVKQGETLSGIAGEVLKDPRLWPQLWEQNEHIINPHWIYPNDKILIRPVTPLVEAKPPEPPAEVAPAPAPPRPPEPAPQRVVPPRPAPAPVATPTAIVVDKRPPVPEVKYGDLYCSGFVRTAHISEALKVIAKYDATGAVLSGEGDYVYLNHGSEDGVTTGSAYDVIRPTKTLTSHYGRLSRDRDLGMHYLDIAQVRVVLARPDFSLARVMHSCGDAIEVGDALMPFEPVAFPQPPRPRPFSPTMETDNGTSGIIASAMSVLLNFGSTFHMSGEIPGVRGSDRLGSLERGVAETGTIVYIDVGSDKGVKPGDLFIVFRNLEFDTRLFPPPTEIDKLRNSRSAIGELIVVRVGERASTALVTYATDGLTLGDVVERRK